ncbi:hypothetical protein K402DRAFT_393369 [Aulographum hederae CBS 113979]|uniref:Uncharacterized protein n=1 Tax=Aulographum hederae CBS 113979 TaxID=1176131 RepID=A0A6G1H108_9PEZI|nr:hypothetical protein K402DRAFT_393369 [Aulographum hederae CBS 113979]
MDIRNYLSPACTLTSTVLAFANTASTSDMSSKNRSLFAQTGVWSSQVRSTPYNFNKPPKRRTRQTALRLCLAPLPSLRRAHVQLLLPFLAS